jgi:hypothetical protein
MSGINVLYGYFLYIYFYKKLPMSFQGGFTVLDSFQ